MLKYNIGNEDLWTDKESCTQPARDFGQSAIVKLVMNALVLTDSTGHGNAGFRHTRSVIDDHGAFIIIAPSSSGRSPGKAPERLSLDRALAIPPVADARVVNSKAGKVTNEKSTSQKLSQFNAAGAT